MPDKGTMIALRVDNERIKTPAPLHENTALMGLEERAVIAAPETPTFREVAVEAQRGLAELTGVELPLVDDAEFAGAEALASNVLAVGHAGSNWLLRRLHDLRCMGSGDYPKQGRRVLSVHSPLGDGRNVIAALGASPEIARRSVERMLTHVREAGGEWRIEGHLFDVDPIPETPDPEECAEGDRLPYGGQASAFLTALSHLNAACEERWARDGEARCVVVVDDAQQFATQAKEVANLIKQRSGVRLWSGSTLMDQQEAASGLSPFPALPH